MKIHVICKITDTGVTAIQEERSIHGENSIKDDNIDIQVNFKHIYKHNAKRTDKVYISR